MRRKKLGGNASPAVLFEQNKSDPLGSAKKVSGVEKEIPAAPELKLPAVPVLTETVASPVQESAQQTPAPLPVGESDSCEGKTIVVPVLSSADFDGRQWSETVEIPQRVLAGREKHVLRGYRCIGTNFVSAFAEGAFAVVDISGGRYAGEGFYLIRINGRFAVRRITELVKGGYLFFFSDAHYEKVDSIKGVEFVGQIIWIDKEA
jgi:hypothetical protein